MHTHGYTIGESKTSIRILAFAAIRAEFKETWRVPPYLWTLYKQGEYQKVIKEIRRTSK